MSYLTYSFSEDSERAPNAKTAAFLFYHSFDIILAEMNSVNH